MCRTEKQIKSSFLFRFWLLKKMTRDSAFIHPRHEVSSGKLFTTITLHLVRFS